jgi:hypothetical protein
MHNTYIDLELSAIRIFDGGIITLDPLIVDELGSQAAFTYATCRETSESDMIA